MTAARPGRAEEQEVLPLTLDEARSVLVAASGRRNGVKWDIALALGLRQGEVLGLQWDDGGGLLAGPPKSTRGTRMIVLPAPLQAALRTHRSAQAAERLAAGELWQPPLLGGLHTGSGWVFASPVGKAIDPRRDWAELKKLLDLAGVRDARLHDARHTAANLRPIAAMVASTRRVSILGEAAGTELGAARPASASSLTAPYLRTPISVADAHQATAPQVAWPGWFGAPTWWRSRRRPASPN